MDNLKFLALGNFNEVNPNEVWDFCHLDEVPNSIFQLQILLSRAELKQHLTDEYSQFPNTTINTLDKQIMGSLYKKLFFNQSIVNTNIKFLEHQYRLTKDKNIFLNDLKKRIAPTYYSTFWGDVIPIVVNAHDIFNEVKSWMERKIEQLSHEEYLRENSVQLKARLQKNDLKHRHHALIYKYKANAGYIVPNAFNGTEIQKEFGAKRKQAFYSVWDKTGKTYKAPTWNELNVIIPHLADYPNAQKAVINDLAKLS